MPRIRSLTFTPPTPIPATGKIGPRVFLAGSIEMGAAENWQTVVCALLSNLSERTIEICNPRRDDWDSSWRQSLDDQRFVEQVEWGLTALESSDIISFYFAPDSKAPITLMEFGLWARDPAAHKIVCCPEGFWKKGNVDVVCRRYGILQVADAESLAHAILRQASSKPIWTEEMEQDEAACIRAYARRASTDPVPINVVLHCPKCHQQHIDEPSGEWTNPPHRSHQCQHCGCVWRAADVPTNGVKATATRGSADSWDPVAQPPGEREGR